MELNQSRERYERIVRALPTRGLFADQHWRISLRAFPLSPRQTAELFFLGRVLARFYQVAQTLYFKSVEGSAPLFISDWLDRGKPGWLIDLQRARMLRAHFPRVIRPDLLLTESGFALSELDSVPGGIGLTAWLQQTYAALGEPMIGGNEGMQAGFQSIFSPARPVKIVVSEESASYRPEMEWLASRFSPPAEVCHDATSVADGDAVYRFFELFDCENIAGAKDLITRAALGKISLTPPPKAFLEEKLLLALFWNRNLRDFWYRELGAGFDRILRELIPYAAIVDPTPLPPQAEIGALGISSWEQLKHFSKGARDLIIKISGYSSSAWGARGVSLGSDLSLQDWTKVVDHALHSAGQHPYIIQHYEKPTAIPWHYWSPEEDRHVEMQGRVRLAPYYFLGGDTARPQLGGVLATICPADKKIIHGMTDACLVPCRADESAV